MKAEAKPCRGSLAEKRREAGDCLVGLLHVVQQVLEEVQLGLGDRPLEHLDGHRAMFDPAAANLGILALQIGGAL